jgi:hypothetical protein
MPDNPSMPNTPDRAQLRQLFAGTPPTVMAVSRDDKLMASFSRTPPTLREKLAAYGGHTGQEATPWGDTVTIDLSAYANRPLDDTFIVISYNSQPAELRGATGDAAKAWFRQRLGLG